MLYNAVKFIFKIYFSIFYNIQIHGIPPEIIQNRGHLICCNHRHWSDPIILSICIKEPIHWLAKIELFKNSILKRLLTSVHAIAVDRHAGDMKSLRIAIKELKDGTTVGIFPEGTRLKRDDINAAKPGIALLAMKSNAIICPAAIRSSFKLFSTINVYWGEPYSLEDRNGRLSSEDYEKIAKEILNKIYTMGCEDSI
ncbi:MAG: 1-acyl-sn-glycerol-3-phosphate acyltransferase [Tissierellia bacterium]|nr:1-acyl-sn-glycerol-3-phosphate acyltransferase [Tissierellia bacterium]